MDFSTNSGILKCAGADPPTAQKSIFLLTAETRGENGHETTILKTLSLSKRNWELIRG